MRNRAHWNSPYIRLSLLLTLGASQALVGCGGGGGGNNGGGGGGGGGVNPTLATVTGFVKDFNGTGVENAKVTIVGTTKTVLTSSTGQFTFTNVPLTATRFLVNRPSNTGFYDVVQFQAKRYDTTQCNLPLPTLVAGANQVAGDVSIFGAKDPNNAVPPPPPTGGCP